MAQGKGLDAWILNLDGAKVLLIACTSVAILLVGMGISVGIRESRRDALAERVLPKALPAFIAAVRETPLDARVRLKPFWDDLQSLAPLRVELTEGGSALRWDPVQESTCEQVKTFLVQNPAAGREVTLIEDGSVIAPGSYEDMVCFHGDRSISTLTFKPRS